MNKTRTTIHWKQIKCPFFHKDEALFITCEGWKDGTLNTLRFPTQALKIEYQNKYCKLMSYDKCAICKIANEKYEENQNDTIYNIRKASKS